MKPHVDRTQLQQAEAAMNHNAQRQPGNRWLHGTTDDIRRTPNENQGRRNQRQREFNPQRNVFGAAPRRRNTFLEGA